MIRRLYNRNRINALATSLHALGPRMRLTKRPPCPWLLYHFAYTKLFHHNPPTFLSSPFEFSSQHDSEAFCAPADSVERRDERLRGLRGKI